MSVYLDVGFASQLTFGGTGPSNSWGPPGQRDPTGCWYASACMVGNFFEIGPRLGVPELHKVGGLFRYGGHEVLPVAMVATLAKNEHLEPVPGAGSALSSKDLEELLRSSGPLWFAWIKTAGGASYGHVSVVIGVDDTTVAYHDPEDAPKSQMSLDLFNARRYTEALKDSSMLRRAGSRASIRGWVLQHIRAKL
jgi:Papain-like cysteine protease AvrRpt2